MADYQQASGLIDKKQMRSVKFFNLYLSNLGKIMLTSLLFVPFDILAVGYIILVYKFMGGLNVTVAAAALIILNIGMSGVAQVCRYIYIEKEFSTVSAFFKGIRENALRFLLHGVFFYAVFSVSYLSIYMYLKGTESHAVLWAPLVITALIAIGILFASYYLNLMTVTLDISLKNTYRNCILFSFGELRNNVLATIGLLILGGVLFSIVYIINNLIAAIVFLSVMQLLFVPSTLQYILTFYLYDDMVAILDESKRTSKGDDQDEPGKSSVLPVLNDEDAGALEQLYEDSRDEFIYYNGRMIRRSEVEKLIGNDE